MKRAIVITIILSILTLAGFAQRQFQRQFQKPLRSSTEGRSGLGQYYVGLKAGCPWTTIRSSHLNETKSQGHFGYMLGLEGVYFFKKYSIGLETTLGQRGDSMQNERTYQISLSQDGLMEKQMRVIYDVIAIRFPLYYHFNHLLPTKKIIPYAFVAPGIELPMPFSIQREAGTWLPSVGKPLIESTITIDHGTPLIHKEVLHPKMDVVASLGIGSLFILSSEGATTLLRLNLGVNTGFLNQASSALSEGGVFFRGQGLEFSAALLFHLKKPLRDAGYYFSRSGYSR